MSLGDRLREERERLGLNQPKMAEMMGTTKQTIYAWENGRTAPDGFQLEALAAAAAGADVRYIVTGERDGPPPLKPDEQMLLDRYRSSPQPLRDAALRVLLGGEQPSSGTRKIRVSGGHAHQVAGGKIVNKGGEKKK